MKDPLQNLITSSTVGTFLAFVSSSIAHVNCLTATSVIQSRTIFRKSEEYRNVWTAWPPLPPLYEISPLLPSATGSSLLIYLEICTLLFSFFKLSLPLSPIVEEQLPLLCSGEIPSTFEYWYWWWGKCTPATLCPLGNIAGAMFYSVWDVFISYSVTLCIKMGDWSDSW